LTQLNLIQVLNDAIMLLDDSLGRLIDIRQIQLAMENAIEWNSQPFNKIQERTAYFEGQERSAKAFLSLAIATLNLLLNLAKEVVQQFVATSEIRLRLVAMLLHFFEILCGPKMINLKVKNPEKYLFNPKGTTNTRSWAQSKLDSCMSCSFQIYSGRLLL